MTTNNTKGRALAIIAGCAFAAGGLTILLDKDLTKPLEWTSSHWLTILTVFGTIAAGHLMVDAARARHLFATLGFLMLFLSGTGLVVYNSVGRQAEAAGTTMLSVEDTNKKIAEKSTDLESAKARRDYANRQADKEMTGQRCGPRCKDWRQNAKDISIVIHQLESEIAALGPQKPVNAQAAAMADIGLLFGIPASKAQVVAALTLLIPFLKTLFFEIGSIVSLGFAFRSGPVARALSDHIGQSDFPAVERPDEVVHLFGPDPDNGSASKRPDGPKRPGPSHGLSKAEALDDLMQRLADGQTIPSQQTLADDWNRPKQTVHEWMKGWRRIGIIPPATPAGRCKATAPA